MSRAQQLRAGAFYILAGQGAGQLLGIARNFVVARLISPFDFGVAAAIAATLSVLELASDAAWDKLIIQASDGDDPALQAVCHSLMIIRGIILSVLLFAVAPFIATFFSVSEATSTFQCLAIAPLVRGFAHLDVKRFQRDLKFRADTDVVVLGQLLGVVVAIFAAYWLGDYRAMLAAILAQSLMLTLGAHYKAERPYRLAWGKVAIMRSMTFGWPLMLNGVVIVIAGQLDRFLVGGMLGVEQLALYAVAVMLISSPMLVVTKVVGALALPVLSKAQSDQSEFVVAYRSVGTFVFLSALAMFLPLGILGADLVTLIFGAAYAGPIQLVPWLVLGLGVRFIRGWPIVASLARGDTKNVLIVNLVRILGVVAGFVAIKMGAGIVGLAASLALGELFSFVAGIVRQNMKSNMHMAAGADLLIIFLICCSMPIFLAEPLANITVAGSVGAAVLITMISVAAMLLISRDSRNVMLSLIGKAIRP
ncbi:MAG: hypothetical protein COA62_08130 [Rhodobiaceae bacterium]|nr:MAG: hypothetical protein COA62_08130 [Rhodobiaceae bacterium]